jgi:hypothetical protein
MEKDNINRPYPPSSNVITVLQRLRSRNLPERIDDEYLRDAGIPEGTISRTLFALRFLKLINEADEPNDAVKSIHVSTDEEYKTIMSGLIREAYKEVFNVIDPTQDSQEKILNVFRRYTPASQRERMVVFFLGMCRDAGIPTQDVPKARAMAEKSPNTARKAPSQRIKLGPHIETKQVDEVITNPALDLLIKSLPKPGQQLSKDKLEQWIDMARATLRFVYPVSLSDIKEDEHSKDEQS